MLSDVQVTFHACDCSLLPCCFPDDDSASGALVKPEQMDGEGEEEEEGYPPPDPGEHVDHIESDATLPPHDDSNAKVTGAGHGCTLRRLGQVTGAH